MHDDNSSLFLDVLPLLAIFAFPWQRHREKQQLKKTKIIETFLCARFTKTAIDIIFILYFILFSV